MSASARILACCGGMVIVAGMERMTFEVLRVLSERGAVVHCILNGWENHRIRPLVESIGATRSTGAYRCPLRRHERNPVYWVRLGWDIIETSLGLLRDARRFRPTHVFLPEFGAALRNAPALLVLRSLGIPVILRMANHPDRGRFYDFLWGRVLPRLVTRFVANSEFARGRALEAGVPPHQLSLIRNAVSHRQGVPERDAVRASMESKRTLLCVGQIAPYKGTHLAVEAGISLLQKRPDLQLVVVGAAPEWPPERVSYFQDLQDRVASSELDERIRFVGAREDVLELMASSFLLLAPILQEETFGNVVLEAKSVGLPVVAFPRGGIPELVEHLETGYLCESCDVEGLVRGVEYFLTDPRAWCVARAASLASFEAASCDYHPEVFAGNWQVLFEEAR